MASYTKYICLSLFLLILLTPHLTHAGAEPCGVKGAIPMQVYIPFITAVGDDPIKETVKDPVTGISEEKERPCYYLKPFTKDTSGKEDAGEKAGELADYIAGLYFFAVSIGGMVAMVMIIVGGFQWMMAGGNAQGIGKAKEKITNASLGLVLLLFSYTILWTINPALVRFGSVLPAGSDKSSFTPQTKPKLSAEQVSDFLINRNMGSEGTTTISEAAKKTANDAVEASKRMMRDVNEVYAEGKPELIQQIIDRGLEAQKKVATGTVANTQQEIDKLRVMMDEATQDYEKNVLTEYLQKAEEAHQVAVNAERTIIKSIADAYFLKTCAEAKAAWFTSVDAACP